MEEEINLREIGKGIWRRKIIIIILTIIALGLGIGISLGKTDKTISEDKNEDIRVMYAKTSFTIVPTDNFKITETTATTYQHMIKNTQNLERIIEKFDLDMEVSELYMSIAILRVSYSDIIEIGITNENLLDKSLEILEDITTVLNEELKNTYSINDIYIVQKPRLLEEEEIEKSLESVNEKTEEVKTEENDSKGKTIIVTTLAGVIIGFVVVIAIEVLDGSIKNENGLENNLGIINLNKISNNEDELRKVKLNIKNVKSVLITDLYTEKAKNDIVENLSQIYAKYGKKVGLIDITQDKLDIFSVEASKIKLDDISNDNLVEVLETEKIKNVFEELNQKFDIIIVNGNNILNSINTLKISETVEGTVCVVEVRKTKMKLLKKIEKNLNDIGSNLLGTIIVEK